MAMDRQYVMQLVQQIVCALIQNPRAAEQVDILGLLDYWVAMMDVELQLKQFTKTPEQIQQEAQAAAGGVGEGTGVEPATTPQAVTEHCYGERDDSAQQYDNQDSTHMFRGGGIRRMGEKKKQQKTKHTQN